MMDEMIRQERDGWLHEEINATYRPIRKAFPSLRILMLPTSEEQYLEEGAGWKWRTSGLADLLSAEGHTVIGKFWYDKDVKSALEDGAFDLLVAKPIYSGQGDDYNSWLDKLVEQVSKPVIYIESEKRIKARQAETFQSRVICPFGSWVSEEGTLAAARLVEDDVKLRQEGQTDKETGVLKSLLAAVDEVRRDKRDELLAPRFGMRLSRLTDQVLEDLIAIYDDSVGANSLEAFRSWGPNLRSSYPRNSLTCANKVGWQLGSGLSPDSRLFINEVNAPDEVAAGERVIYFSFDPNVEGAGAKADYLTCSFRQNVDAYLEIENLALELGKPSSTQA